MRWPHALRSLQHRNVQLFAMGQSVSLTGTWMQNVAMGWLVYRLTGDPKMLGWVAFLGQIPSFALGAFAGSLADRFPRRRLLYFTLSLALAQAVLLAILTFSGHVTPTWLLVLAGVLGVSTAIEVPTRHSLLADIAGADTPNAVALNSTIVNLTRIIGPAVGGLVVAAVGEAWCFALNALSFGGVLLALWRMRLPAPRISHASTGLMEGLRFTTRHPLVRTLFLMLAVSSFFAFPFQQLMPVVVRDVLLGNADMLGYLGGCFGAGALTAAVLLLRRTGVEGLSRRIAIGASALGVGIVALAISRNPWASGAALVVAGFGFLIQSAGTLTLLQAVTPDGLRGRVLGLFSMVFIGVTPFGALASAWLAAHFGVGVALAIGGATAVVASLASHFALAHVERADAPAT